MARLKYAAIDEAYLGDGQAYCSTITSVRNKMRAMAILEEMIMVRGITNGASVIKRRWQFMLSAAASKMDCLPVSDEELPGCPENLHGGEPSRRWTDLAGSSPLLLLILPQRARTIVYPSLLSLRLVGSRSRTIPLPTQQSKLYHITYSPIVQDSPRL